MSGGGRELNGTCSIKAQQFLEGPGLLLASASRSWEQCPPVPEASREHPGGEGSAGVAQGRGGLWIHSNPWESRWRSVRSLREPQLTPHPHAQWSLVALESLWEEG